MDNILPPDHKEKMKESEKGEQVFGPCQRTKKAEEHRVTVIPIVIDTIGTIPSGLEKELE